MKFRSFAAPIFILALAGIGLAGCRSEAPPVAPPPAAEAPLEATGHYCGMLLSEHSGPKGQIHLASRDAPVWFTSVRDTIAFLRLPEEARDVTAVYVHDMGRARQWDQPEAGTWVRLDDALFVIESDRVGGMGAPEAVPFSEQVAAESYVQEHGGRILRLAEIPDDYVIGPVEIAVHPGHDEHAGHGEDPAHATGSNHGDGSAHGANPDPGGHRH